MSKLRSKLVEQQRINVLQELIDLPHARVLDVGAGRVIEKNSRTGFTVIADCYARLMQKQEYIGLEIETDSRPSVVGDAHRLPFADNTMDGVLMMSVLEHLCDPIRAVDEVYRVLKPGGVFFSYAPFYHRYHPSPHDYFRFTEEGYRYLLRDFRAVELISGGNYFAVLNDVLSDPLTRAGRPGRALSSALSFFLKFLFRRFDGGMSSRLAAGFGACARK